MPEGGAGPAGSCALEGRRSAPYPAVSLPVPREGGEQSSLLVREDPGRAGRHGSDRSRRNGAAAALCLWAWGLPASHVRVPETDGRWTPGNPPRGEAGDLAL